MDIKVDINTIVRNLSAAEFTNGQLVSQLEQQKRETRRARANYRALRKAYDAQAAEMEQARADANLYFGMYKRAKDELAAAKEGAENEQ